jgi:tetratricopeptide (TPR) repeat protein
VFFKKDFDFTLNNLFQEKGNQYVKMGKKHYSDAIDCYTRAIDQKASSDSETSILFSNRAHVNLLLGNFRRALNDANDSIKLSPSNIKVCTLLWPCLDKQLICKL